MKIKKFALAMVCVLTFSGLAGCGGNASADTATSGDTVQTDSGSEASVPTTNPETQVLLASHVFNNTHPWHLGLEYLGELLYERTDGKYTIEVHPSSSLSGGSNRSVVEMCGTGGLDLMILASLSFEGFNPNYGVFTLPFLFPSRDVAFDVMNNSEIGREAMTWLEANGVTGVALVENGMRNLTNSKHPVVTPEDLQGLKIRVPESAVLISDYKAWGADPTPLSMAEVYTSIQQGTVDGQENPIAAIDSNKLYEVCPYITVWTYCWEPAWIMFNTDFYESLSDEERAIFEQASLEAAQYTNRITAEQDAEKLQGFRDYGCEVIELTQEQQAVFKEQASNVYDEFKEKLGAEMVDEIIAEVEKYSK